jgi:hypothetical protein
MIRSQEDVIVIGHQGKGKDINMILIRHFSERIQERHPIPVITKNVVPFISARQDMIQPAFIFYPPCSAHESQPKLRASSSQRFLFTMQDDTITLMAPSFATIQVPSETVMEGKSR